LAQNFDFKINCKPLSYDLNFYNGYSNNTHKLNHQTYIKYQSAHQDIRNDMF